MFDVQFGTGKVLIPLRIEAATWFDARAYGAQWLGVDTMNVLCRPSQPGYRADLAIEWRGSDYNGQRQLWMRQRDKSGRWRPWVLA
jgi:hypothetical protein